MVVMTIPNYDGWTRTESDEYEMYNGFTHLREEADCRLYQRGKYSIYAFFIDGACEHAWLQNKDGDFIDGSDDIPYLIELADDMEAQS